MTLDELKQIKKDVSNGIVISRATWLKVLDAAIEQQMPMNKEIHCQEFHELAMAYRAAWSQDAQDYYLELINYIEKWHTE